DAGEGGGFPEVFTADAGHGAHQVEDVGGDQGQVLDLLLGQHLADAGGGLRQQRGGRGGDLDGLGDFADLEGEVVAAGDAAAEADVAEGLGLEAGQFGGEP